MECTMEERHDFVKELHHMKDMDCFHIVKLLGVVRGSFQWTETIRTPLVVMELLEGGDLATYLRRTGDENAQGKVEERRAIKWAIEIADGMAYLRRIRMVHRDLAARNCLLDANLVAKVGDFGMTRDVNEDYYYRIGNRRAKVPIRWMAPESMPPGKKFDSQSDVWAFGVVLWEIGTLASVPYHGFTHEEIIDFVVNGNNLGFVEQPQNCPEILRSIMEMCWEYDPKSRPTFDQILNLLQHFMSEEFAKVSFYHNGLKNTNLSEININSTPSTNCLHMNSTLTTSGGGSRASHLEDLSSAVTCELSTSQSSPYHQPSESRALLSQHVATPREAPPQLPHRTANCFTASFRRHPHSGKTTSSEGQEGFINLHLYSSHEAHTIDELQPLTSDTSFTANTTNPAAVQDDRCRENSSD